MTVLSRPTWLRRHHCPWLSVDAVEEGWMWPPWYLRLKPSRQTVTAKNTHPQNIPSDERWWYPPNVFENDAFIFILYSLSSVLHSQRHKKHNIISNLLLFLWSLKQFINNLLASCKMINAVYFILLGAVYWFESVYDSKCNSWTTRESVTSVGTVGSINCMMHLVYGKLRSSLDNSKRLQTASLLHAH